MLEGSGTTWLPEVFGAAVAAAIREMPREDVERLRDTLAEAVEAGAPAVEIAGEKVAATPAALAAVKGELQRRDDEAAAPADDSGAEKPAAGPIVLDTADNFDEVAWKPDRGPRRATGLGDVPLAIRTPLKAHQIESLRWQQEAWASGLPGVLNADEQGLGKTLQTISFLVWLKEQMAAPSAEVSGPILVVAPTSLLRNWEEEVARHIDEPGLGHLIRLYGSATGALKRTGALGKDTDDGDARLEFDWLDDALADGRAHRFWILTTYTTLTNYQHSLGRIPFAAAVFDEVQAVKNPGSLRAAAGRAIQADFRIALTGTPIENSTVDLWAVMDQVAPGALGSLREFRQTFGTPAEDNMAQLYARVFRPGAAHPALGLRRLKDEVAKDLPSKTRRIHPALMPSGQAKVYEDARVKLAGGGMGAALKMLHHIRTVSVHPAVDDPAEGPAFVSMSARLERTFQILDGIRSRGERALIFIESLKMQYRFAEIARRRYGLHAIDIINGSTPIPKRQEIVNRFQRHLDRDDGFDLLVLGPKAAGTGLTLTAATHVVHLSRWWNPAVEEQCNDRVHRIGQSRPVTVHLPMAIHAEYRDQSFDCLLQSLMQRKRRLASSALWPMGDTQEDAEQLRQMLSGSATITEGDAVAAALSAMFKRDGFSAPPRDADGSVVVP
jgi:SNF2 family DNA or RNA helicase